MDSPSSTKVPEWRKSTFKNRGVKQDDMRRRREEASVEIRKNKREESLAKRRNLPPTGITDADSEDDAESVQVLSEVRFEVGMVL